ncbi:MAG: aldehyde dehydrogenase (NAD+) [Afipia broomeae]|jgi:aldehyde dehydrogenase (NAD+)|nr:MAG: aldehyde dehydrogenase family protein [Bradyrhizobiaceae bacterium]
MNVEFKAAQAQGIFFNNRWRPASTGKSIPVVAPADGVVFAEIAAGDAADIDMAVTAARSAFEGGAWSKMTATERGRLLMRLARLIEDRAESLAALEAKDTGKPMRLARGDIAALARYFEYYGGAADKMHGEMIPFLHGYHVSTVWEPLGVTGHIIPWNYPAQMMGRTLAPALAVGNATVIKPAEEACLVPLKLGELAAEAGFPEGVVNIVPGLGEEAGASLSAHRGIDFISFTGSPEVGILVQTAAARNHIGCTLELGGKSPQVVFADADFDAAISAVVNGIIQNAGQTCSAGSRALIQRNIWDKFIAGLVARFGKLKAGSPEMDLDLGPVISAHQKKGIEGFIDRAAAAGVPCLARGQIADGVPPNGFYVPPTIFGPAPRDSQIAREEVFGPVLAALPFEDEEDAIRLANGTDFGLVAGVWSGDGARALRVAKKIRAGQVFVNGYGAGGGIELPFGGMKKSGHGREKGFEALYDLAALKTIVIKHG